MKQIVSLVCCLLFVLSLLGCNNVSPAPSDEAQISEKSDLTSFKILAIGNSFSVDALTYLYDIAKAEGVSEIVIGNLYIGGCTLNTHAGNAEEQSPVYRFYKNTDGEWKQTEGYALLQGLQEESWDIITLQQASGYSGNVDSFDPYLNVLVEFINANKTNPEAKLLWHMTWAYQGDSTHSAFANYGNSQQAMYYSVVNAVKQKIDTNEAFAMVIPAGTAIQNVRTSYIGDNLTRDGHHLNVLGRVIAAYTWYALIDGKPLKTLKFSSISHELTLTENDKAMIVEAVNNAISNPYQVTESAYK
jgi:hypothetical protein